MAYSMMSSTNYKRKCWLSLSPTEADYCSLKETDSISTLNIEDLTSNSFDIESSSFFSSFLTSSMASDDLASDFVVHNNSQKFISKKRKTMEAFVDQELEDTASSPVQSPKINGLELFYMKSREMDSREVSQENGHTSQQAGDSSNNMSFLESELRKKGLCLIPTSMLLNYLSTNI
ncbi:vascular-related unknown protein 1 [Beta vulgaris subsp. vulgaris]|uniref:vascular-related unknown protein 1 n=1 Tax=Beta vulgaris subsp. vulgaris TaxID=3555 RepID=UPI0020373092|nr:vascular-related unknown protein 1 [Beta vulgaris subsp. vulgaris]